MSAGSRIAAGDSAQGLRREEPSGDVDADRDATGATGSSQSKTRLRSEQDWQKFLQYKEFLPALGAISDYDDT